MKLYFLGGGNMASSIIAALKNQHSDLSIHVVERYPEQRETLVQRFGVSVSETLPTLQKDDVLLLAIKPQDMAAACANIQTNGALVLSIAAGLSVDTLSQYLGGTHRIVRIMPNTPARVGLGVAGLFADVEANDDDQAFADKLMSSCGQTIWLKDEAQMHAITAVSGSGPAYVFYLLNALQAAAQAQGFDEKTAYEMSLQTFKGAVALAEQSDLSFGELQQQVTSKGGTTFAALECFRKHQLDAHFIDGVNAAAERSLEMAKM
ncbi:MAG: pyrroline-5-carboxylate reductase [Neisseriaceae bacterium]|nr:pyrroline-5-carboxylate reductase [Neisseriaceae bacterium]